MQEKELENGHKNAEKPDKIGLFRQILVEAKHSGAEPKKAGITVKLAACLPSRKPAPAVRSVACGKGADEGII